MRVLVTSTPGTGHLHALAPVAGALRDAGHEVWWATAADSCAAVERFGFAALPAGMALNERMARFAELRPDAFSLPPRHRRAVHFPVLFGELAAPVMASDLATVIDEISPDVVVHEMSELGAAPVATTRQIPHVTVAFSGEVPRPILAAGADAVAPVWASLGLDAPPDAGLYAQLYLHPFPAAFGQIPAHDNVRHLRPSQFDGGDDDPPSPWAGTLGEERPAVYVTFGTEMGPMAPWPALLAALGALDVDVVATTGGRIDPAGLPSPPPNVRIERYVPQRHVLDRATVVVSHAGAGTMLAAAARALPQLFLPIAADQWDNADAAGESGATLTLEADDRDPAAIGDAISRLLDDPRFTAAATTAAHQIDELPSAVDRVATIVALAEHRPLP